MSVDPGRAIAEEVFYEGYVLWPYRHAAAPTPTGKQFSAGRVYPRGCPDGPDRLHAECLVEGDDPAVEVTVRFLHPVERRALDADGGPVDEVTVAGEAYRSRDEAIEREVKIPSLPGRTAAIATAGEQRQVLTEGGQAAGALAWQWQTLHGTVEAWLDEIEPDLRRIRVEIANRLEWSGSTPEETLSQTLCSTHAVLHSPDGSFLLPTDPMAELREAVSSCHSEGLWPVALDGPGDRHTILASPTSLDREAETIHVSGPGRRTRA